MLEFVVFVKTVNGRRLYLRSSTFSTSCITEGTLKLIHCALLEGFSLWNLKIFIEFSDFRFPTFFRV